MAKSVPVGLTNLVYAIMTADVPPTTVGGTDGVAAYDAAVRVLGAITANFSPNAANDTLFADDGPYETASTLGAMTLELNVADIPAPQRAEMLGATYNATNGVLAHSSEDIPPYLAVGMSVKKSNGYDRYIWYLKGKFTAPDDNNQTKADSINWNTPTISGNFLKRDADNQWKFQIDTDDVHADPTVLSSWFESPNVATLATLGDLTADPPSGALVAASEGPIVIACGTAEATIEYKKSTEAVWSAYSAGVDCAAWGATGVVVLNVRASKTGYATKTQNFTYQLGS